MGNHSKRTAFAVASGSRSSATSFDSSDLMPLLDRPIAYQRIFAHVCGDPIAAILLSQAFFWSSRTKDTDGWFYKTQAEWFEETGLTRRHQETARKKLVSLGVLEEVRRGIPAQLFFRLDVARLAELIRAFLDKKRGGEEGENEQPRMAESAILPAPKSHHRMADSAIQASLKTPHTLKATKNTSKTSTKTTTPRGREDFAATPLVVDVDESLLSQMQAVGVTERIAKQLLTEKPDECRQQLQWLPMRDAKKQAATLVASIRDGWSAPEAVLERERKEQQAQETIKQREQAAQKRAEEERAKAEEQANSENEGEQIDAFFAALPPEEQERINEEARRRLGVLGNMGRAPVALMMMRRQLLRPELRLG